MNKDGEPSEEDVKEFRELVNKSPELWPFASQASSAIRRFLINRMSHGVGRALLVCEEDVIKKEFGFDDSPILERLLIDHIVTTRMRLLYAEDIYNAQVVEASLSPEAFAYLDRFLSSAHRRHLRAVETLAKVRKLSRSTPALQINIARDGGQQVNVQGAEAQAGRKPRTPV